MTMSRWSWQSQKLLNDHRNFGAFSSCRVLQCPVQSFADGPPGISHGSRLTMDSEEKVHSYLDGLNKYSSELIVLSFTNTVRHRNGKLPLSLSRDLFDRINIDFELSSKFLAIHASGSMAYRGAPTSDIGEKWSNSQYVVQMVRSKYCFSMSLSFDIKSGRTCILLLGAEAWFVDTLYAALQSMCPLPFGPMVVPIVAYEVQGNAFNQTITDLTEQIFTIEHTTGMRSSTQSHHTRTTEEKWINADLIGITCDLSSLLSRLAFLKLQGESGHKVLQQTRSGIESLIKELRGTPYHDRRTEDQHNMIFKLDDLVNMYDGIKLRCGYLHERATAQTQTVYCLVASHDNLTNMDLARASHRIAEDSRTIAVAAAQDSAVMRVIAVVTMFFLPATFTSTFFSMTFFNFLDSEVPRASQYIWIYFVATAVLTIMVQSFWAYMSKREKAKLAAQT